jgi:predicted ArsR family transcriptional regulator
MSSPSQRPASRRAATREEAKALAHPDRLRIIRLTFDEALTNKELADRLGRNPGTTLYHLRMLVATGFVAAEQARRGARGAAELPYRSTGKSWTLDVGEPDPDVTGAMVEAFRAELLESPVDTRKASRLALRLTREQRAELEARLEALVEEAASWPRADDGEPWALFVAMHERATGAGSGSGGDPRLS